MMIEVYIDGVIVGNFGFSGVGILIKGNGEYYCYVIVFGIMMNYEVEYYVFFYVLKICLEKKYMSVFF